ncbi:unnamed protein product [Protopolystoma xenopodis]|uniref:Uncharacterized protein n=1 Tax=Protopolystoma xenopodis TaxID=117903 RepID=A0A448XHF4_9PLAT|nr:unnamed protein product [Protopolystoma xenopodis]
MVSFTFGLRHALFRLHLPVRRISWLEAIRELVSLGCRLVGESGRPRKRQWASSSDRARPIRQGLLQMVSPVASFQFVWTDAHSIPFDAGAQSHPHQRGSRTTVACTTGTSRQTWSRGLRR